MTNYVQHLGVTAWRKKSALLIAIGLLSIIIFGLQFSRINEKAGLKEETGSPHMLAAEPLIQNNVKFVETNQRPNTVKTVTVESNFRDFGDLEQPSRDEVARRRSDSLETEQQLGIPYVNMDKPYIPKKRIVHLDLKGAPPLVTFFKKFFPMIRTMGATGILLGNCSLKDNL